MRSVGDAVAIVVGESEKAVDKALNMIKVKYTVLEPVLDFRSRWITRCSCILRMTGHPA